DMPENMMQAPEMTEAPTAKNEPVTIRRQRPSNVAHQADAAHMDAPAAAEAPAPAQQNIYWQNNDRMAGSVPMSYPPSKTSTAPVPVNSAPPAAQQSMDTNLSTPPAMEQQDDAKMTAA